MYPLRVCRISHSWWSFTRVLVILRLLHSFLHSSRSQHYGRLNGRYLSSDFHSLQPHFQAFGDCSKLHQLLLISLSTSCFVAFLVFWQCPSVDLYFRLFHFQLVVHVIGKIHKTIWCYALHGTILWRWFHYYHMRFQVVCLSIVSVPIFFLKYPQLEDDTTYLELLMVGTIHWNKLPRWWQLKDKRTVRKQLTLIYWNTMM